MLAALRAFFEALWIKPFAFCSCKILTPLKCWKHFPVLGVTTRQAQRLGVNRLCGIDIACLAPASLTPYLRLCGSGRGAMALVSGIALKFLTEDENGDFCLSKPVTFTSTTRLNKQNFAMIRVETR